MIEELKRKLAAEVEKFANVLKSLGVQKGDRVAVYLPMIPELAITMLACARIGAPHSVVFGAFSEGSLRDRINDAEAKLLQAADRSPTWEGWAAVERISEEYGINDVNLVKPGVGETTRVLLRRVPWKILAHRGAGADLDHVRLLAEQRGVPVEWVDDLPYSCVGLIHPQYTRGATGADGKAVATR